jgi:hypothetical protein
MKQSEGAVPTVVGNFKETAHKKKSAECANTPLVIGFVFLIFFLS